MPLFFSLLHGVFTFHWWSPWSFPFSPSSTIHLCLTVVVVSDMGHMSPGTWCLQPVSMLPVGFNPFCCSFSHLFNTFPPFCIVLQLSFLNLNSAAVRIFSFGFTFSFILVPARTLSAFSFVPSGVYLVGGQRPPRTPLTEWELSSLAAPS